MILKPQDVVVLLKLVALGDRGWTFQSLAVELSISQSEVHAAVRRSVAARLMTEATSASGRPVRAALLITDPAAPPELRSFVAQTFARLLADEGFGNALPGLVLDGSPALRTPVVADRLRAIAAMQESGGAPA